MKTGSQTVMDEKTVAIVVADMDVGPFKKLLRDTCGFSFENEREETLLSGLRRRMSSTSREGLAAYLDLLCRDREELRRLIELLTVNETYFLREPDSLRLVTDRIIPEILRERPDGEVRLLSAGCSSGEEAYSVAMLLREKFGGGWGGLCRIAGVDIDGNVLAAARRGVYGKGAFRGMDPGLVDRYFEPYCEGGWRLAGELREAVRFEPANLCAEDYPPVMRNQDVILYRNVSIYFPPDVQREVFQKLAGCLNDGGYLLVGAAETLHHDIGLLTLLERDSLFVYRKISDDRAKDRQRASWASSKTRSPKPSRRAESPRMKDFSGGGRAEPGLNAARDGDAPGGLSCASGTQLRSPKAPKTKVAPLRQDVAGLFDKALSLARDRKTSESMTILEQILERDGAFVPARTLKGSILMDAQRLREARDECLSALAQAPLCLEAKVMLGMASLQEDDAELAQKFFREAIYISPGCWLAHFHLAGIMYSLGERKRARGGYETAMKILEASQPGGHGTTVFPLSFNAAQFMAVCRHKLDILQHAG